jgi:hypothetical protein
VSNADGNDDEMTDIGHGVRVAIRRHHDTGEPGGVYYEHPCIGGKPSPGWIAFPDKDGWPEYHWDLVNLEPLTVTPSLLCPTCKHHGCITDGRWVPA